MQTTTRMVRPMLAKKFEPRYWRHGGMFVQPKLNGIRAMYKAGSFMSRDGILWSKRCLVHIREALAALPAHVVLDGELYIHGLSLQQINSRVAVTRIDPHDDELSVVYNVFDQVSDEGFGIRYADLQMQLLEHVPSLTNVSLVPTHFAGLPEVASHWFSHFKQQGYEGLMYRHPEMPYLLPDIASNKENRSTWLLKRKDWLDLDADINEVCSGNNRLANTCGSLSLRYEAPDGKAVYFSAGSGLSDMDRDKLWNLREAITDSFWCGRPWKCKVRYEMLSDDGIPLKPTIIQVPNLT